MYSYKDTDIAVIGLAGRFPGAANIGEYWTNLKNGVESICFFSDEELLEIGVSENLLHNKNYVKAKGYIENTDYFDSQFFRYTLKEASLMNPQTRLFHEYVYAALEDAGYSKNNPDSKIGLFAGASCDETWRKHLDLQANDNTASQFNNELFVNKDFMCSSVAYKLGLKGPCYAINTACSTSLTAVHVACQSIINNECEMAVAGGASITFPQKNGYIYEEGMFNSPDGHCCAFDKDSKGTIEGNGVGVVVIKKLSKAIEDKDTIYAIIKGSAANNDGNNKLSFTAPSLLGIESVAKEAYEKAEIDLKGVKYIEMHGTGTPLGDAVEIAALKSVFNGQGINECMIGSVKANIGHLDAAAGIASFIKTVLVLYYKQIPPAINFNSPNDELIVENRIFSVNTNLIDLNDRISICAGVNSFGQGGSNVHVVLESFHEKKAEEQENFSEAQVMLFSAKTKQSLQNYIDEFCEYVNDQNEIRLSDASYTLAMTKNHYKHRAYLVAKNYNELKAKHYNIKTVEKNTRTEVVLICDGNNIINKEMITQLYNQYPSYASHIDRHIDINNIINSTDINDRDKVLALIGILSLIVGAGIRIDRFVGYGIGIVALMNLVANVPLDDLLCDESNHHAEQMIKCNCPVYDPEAYDFVDEIGIDSVKVCYEMNMAPDCSNLFEDNTLFIHVSVAELLYASTSFDNNVNRENENRTYALEAIIGELWANGNCINLEKIFDHKNCRKVHLPTYSFDKTEQKLSRSIYKEKGKSVKPHYYKLDWKLDMRFPLLSAEKLDGVLIFAYPQYVNQAIEYFQSFACKFIIAEVGETLNKKNNNHYIFNAEDQSNYDYVFYNIMKLNFKIKYVINLMPLSLMINFDELMSNSILNLNMLRLRSIVFGISKYGCGTDIIIGNVTENLYNLKRPGKTNFSFAGLSGIQEVISKEYMNITCVNVDFNNINKFEEDIFDCILKEICDEKPVKTVVYDQGYRFVPEINKFTKDDSELRITNDGVYIILGGTGRIGKVVADFIAQTASCTIILTGLNKISHSGLFDINDEKSVEKIERDLYRELEGIAQKGSTILLSKVNILDNDSISDFFDSVFQKFGKINGIINCVGVTGKRYNQIIEDTKLADLEQQLQIRENGLIALDFILDKYDYDFCIQFSSIASILGGLGQFGYAGACAFMDQYVRTRNSIKKSRWEVINMDTWITEAKYERACHLIPYEVTFNMLNYIFQNKSVDGYIITFTDIQNYLNFNQSMIDKYQEKTAVETNKKINEVISDIWKEIFGREVAPTESFFDIGGDSLKALEIISSVRNELNVRLKIKDLYSCKTIDKLVGFIEEKSITVNGKTEPLHINRQQEYYECSFSQREMFISKNNIYPTRYNLTCIFSIDGDINLCRLNVALNKLIKRHEINRTRFIVYNGEYHQKIEDDIHLEIRHVYAADIDAEIESFIVGFDVSTLPLLRMQLVTENKSGKQYLLTDMHHAIFDDQSIQMFFTELLFLYSGNVIDDSVKQFREYSCMQHQSHHRGDYLAYQEFWLQKLSEFEYTKLIPDKNSVTGSYKKTSYSLVNEDQYGLIAHFAADRDMSLSSLILSIWMLVISHCASQKHVSAGLRVINRLSEFKNTMGCFLEKVILMVEVDKNISLAAYLKLFEQEYDKTLENSFYPFYLLTQDYKQDKLFSILFNYMIVGNNIICNDDITLIPYKYEKKTLNSKYDFNFRIIDDKGKVSCSLKYKSSSYSDEYIEKMFALFKEIVDNMLNNAEVSIEKIFADKAGDRSI